MNKTHLDTFALGMFIHFLEHQYKKNDIHFSQVRTYITLKDNKGKTILSPQNYNYDPLQFNTVYSKEDKKKHVFQRLGFGEIVSFDYLYDAFQGVVPTSYNNDDLLSKYNLSENTIGSIIEDLKSKYVFIEKEKDYTDDYFLDQQIDRSKNYSQSNDYNGHSVYMFLNEDDDVIYVGRTDNTRDRIANGHFKGSGHLKKSCYKETKRVVYAPLNNKNETMIYELYYISKFRPKYNKTHNDDKQTKGFDMKISDSHLSWKEFKLIL